MALQFSAEQNAPQVLALALIDKLPGDFPGFGSAIMSADWKSVLVSTSTMDEVELKKIMSLPIFDKVSQSTNKTVLSFRVSDERVLDALRILSKDVTAISSATRRSVMACLGETEVETLAYLRRVEAAWRSAEHSAEEIPSNPEPGAELKREQTQSNLDLPADIARLQRVLKAFAAAHIAANEARRAAIASANSAAKATAVVDFLQEEMENAHIAAYGEELESTGAAPESS